MKGKFKPLHIIVTGFILLLVVGFSLTTWKMFEFRNEFHKFRNRLYGFINNTQWEQTLKKNGIYHQTDNLIVLFGDSQIDLWPMSPFMGSLPIKNRGISGDLVSKAINRFDKDVISLKPKIVFILIGTNDLARGRKVEAIFNDIKSLVLKSKSHSIIPIIGSILPVNGVFKSNHPQEEILALNNLLRRFCALNIIPFIDIYSQLADNSGYFNQKYTYDGLHPNMKGYFVMSRLLLKEIMKFT